MMMEEEICEAEAVGVPADLGLLCGARLEFLAFVGDETGDYEVWECRKCGVQWEIRKD